MSSEGTAPNAAPEAPNLQVMAQYIKDLSFENPGAAAKINQRPQIDLAVDLNAKRLDNDIFEVELKIRVDAKNDGKALFLLEVGLCRRVPAAQYSRHRHPAGDPVDPGAAHAVPFVRRIVSDVVRDGGMPPLMIEPIDFMSLYQARVAQAGGQPPQGTA